MKPHQHNAGCGEDYCFHGAYTKKADAVAKEVETPGSFILTAAYPPYSIRDRRFAVVTARKTQPRAAAVHSSSNPSHIRLHGAALRRFNQAVEWMQENSWNYHNAQALAQDAGSKYDVRVADLLTAAVAIKSAAKANGGALDLGHNPLFTRGQKRKLKQGARQFVRGLFGFKPIRFASGPQKKSGAQPPSAASSEVRNEVIQAIAEQYHISQRKAAGMVPAAQGGDTFDSLFRRVMAKARRNPESLEAVRAELSPKEREYFDATTDFFREWHGQDPKHVIRRQATIIEEGDYMALGKLFGYDMEGWEHHPFGELRPNVQVKDEANIMLCGELASMETDENDNRIAHQLLICGGDQNLDPVLESVFGVTSTANLLILGRLQNVWYLAKKKVTKYRLTHWHHTFGEEEDSPAKKRDARPYLMYDRVHKKQFIVGGEYSIPVEGIRN